jgi:hypothetical protein
MRLKSGRDTLMPFLQVGAAGVLVVSFLLPWFQGRTSEAGGSSSWVDVLGRSAWLGAIEVDLITFGTVVTVLAAIAGLVEVRRELAFAAALAAVVGFATAALGVVLTLVESGNAAFYWGSWGATIDRGSGLWLFALAALAGTVVAIANLVGRARERAVVTEAPLPASMLAAAPLPFTPLTPATPLAPLAPLTPSVPPTPVRPVEARPAAAGSGLATGTPGLITVEEAGRSSNLSVGEGERVIVGRDLGADIRVADGQVNRRHAMIEWAAGSWIVRDLSSTNPTRILDAAGNAQVLAGQVRIPSGRLLMGEVLVTLYPTGNE